MGERSYPLRDGGTVTIAWTAFRGGSIAVNGREVRRFDSRKELDDEPWRIEVDGHAPIEIVHARRPFGSHFDVRQNGQLLDGASDRLTIYYAGVLLFLLLFFINACQAAQWRLAPSRDVASAMVLLLLIGGVWQRSASALRTTIAFAGVKVLAGLVAFSGEFAFKIDFVGAALLLLAWRALKEERERTLGGSLPARPTLEWQEPASHRDGKRLDPRGYPRDLLAIAGAMLLFRAVLPHSPFTNVLMDVLSVPRPFALAIEATMYGVPGLLLLMRPRRWTVSLGTFAAASEILLTMIAIVAPSLPSETLTTLPCGLVYAMLTAFRALDELDAIVEPPAAAMETKIAHG